MPTAGSTATYDADNRLSRLNGANITYDNDGNLVADGVNTYVWNARGQLASISGPVNASFQYDAVGRRTQKTIGSATTGYLYDGANFVQETDGSNTVTASELSGGLDRLLARESNSGVSVPLTDAIGSVLAETNSAEAQTTTYSYDPYGGTVLSGTNTGNSQQFTARENDGTGLYYFRARYYNPATGRFISEDPIGFRAVSISTDTLAKTPFRELIRRVKIGNWL